MNIRTALIGALVTIVISALTAAVYMGAFIERIKTVEAWIAGDGERTEQAFKDFAEGPQASSARGKKGDETYDET